MRPLYSTPYGWNSSRVSRDTTDSSGVEGPRTPLHYSDVSLTVPPFNLAQLGILPKMLPVTEQENDLLNMAPGSPIKHVAPPGLSQSHNRSERSSYSRSPMSIGSPVGMSSLGSPYKYALARLLPQSSVAEGNHPHWLWRRRWTLPQPTTRKNRMRIREVQDTAHPSQRALLAHCREGSDHNTSYSSFNIGRPACLVWCTTAFSSFHYFNRTLLVSRVVKVVNLAFVYVI